MIVRYNGHGILNLSILYLTKVRKAAVCTFFAHRDCPDTIRPALRAAIIDLIENHGADMIYVGNQSRFDSNVRSVLRQLRTARPQIGYAALLAYMPSGQDEDTDSKALKPFPDALPSPGGTIGCWIGPIMW